MTEQKSSSPVAGGFILAISVLGGALIGATQGQATIGFLTGLGVGAVIATLMWPINRRR